MLQEITYYPILGLPFIVYLGGITLFFFIVTASIALLKRKGKIHLNIVWHYRLAYISLFLAVIHGLLGILAFV